MQVTATGTAGETPAPHSTASVVAAYYASHAAVQRQSSGGEFGEFQGFLLDLLGGDRSLLPRDLFRDRQRLGGQRQIDGIGRLASLRDAMSETTEVVQRQSQFLGEVHLACRATGLVPVGDLTVDHLGTFIFGVIRLLLRISRSPVPTVRKLASSEQS